MALVQSVIRRLTNSLFPPGRIHGRTRGHKWNLLKVREEKYKGRPGRSWKPRARFCSSGAFKTYDNL
jgi:hypothetical protein